MDPRNYWKVLVDRYGDVPGLAEASGIPYSTLAGVQNGSRGVGRELAARLVEFDPLLDKGLLLQIEAVRNDEAA